MPHTSSRYMQDIGFTDGRVFQDAGATINQTSAGSFTLTRVAAGNYSILAANSTTGTIAVNAHKILRRSGFFEDLQQAFGSTFGGGLGGFAAGAGSSGTGIPGEAEFPGRPDTIAGMSTLQELTPRTAFKPKGIRLISFDVIYTVATADVTTLTVRADSIQYINNVAVPTPTVVLASGANGLVKTQRTNAYVINVPLVGQGFSILPDQALWIELSVVTPGGGTFSFFGFDLLFELNYN